MQLIERHGRRMLESYGILVALCDGSGSNGKSAELSIARELGIGLALDRATQMPVLKVWSYRRHRGGKIDAQAKKILSLDPLLGLQNYAIAAATSFLDIGNSKAKFVDVVRRLWGCFTENHCELVEIDPLVVTTTGEFVARSINVVCDPQRLSSLGIDDPLSSLTQMDREAAELGIFPIKMRGDIAVIAPGAGSLMASMDFIEANGGTLAGGIDLGGSIGQRADALPRALGIAWHFEPRAFLINAYLRTSRGDVFANSIITAIGKDHPRDRVAVRLAGNLWKEGHAILGEAGIFATLSFEEAGTFILDAVRS
jgi:succinyl-CoA synthetase beta subunit